MPEFIVWFENEKWEKDWPMIFGSHENVWLKINFLCALLTGDCGDWNNDCN